MTDELIIKAWKMCRENERHVTCEYCLKCPFSKCELDADEENCIDALCRRSINLFTRLNAENKRLRGMVSQNEGVLPQYEALIKAEAIRDFAERLKESAFSCDVSFGYGQEHCEEAVTVLEIDNLVKEMTEDK